MKKILYFNNGRSALDVGIKILSLKKGSKILVPEIICDVVIEIILRNNVEIVYYKLDNKFKPIWSDLYKRSYNKVSCILMVHFFGYPQNLSKFKKLTKEKKILLIEDNCHSLNISSEGNTLGLTGDIGIDSPRKLINNLYSGGRLFINKNYNYDLSYIKEYRPSFSEKIRKKLKFYFPYFVSKFKFFKKRPLYESPYLFSGKDKNFSIKKMDKISKNKFKKLSYKKESLKRVKLFNIIDNFSKNNDIKPIFKISKNLIPLYFVGIAKNHNHAQKVFDWGWKNNIEIMSWPSFYKKDKLRKNLLKRWKKYICIPLDQDFQKKYEKFKLN